jgi:hypothetical protein
MHQPNQSNNFIYLFFALTTMLFASTVIVEFPGTIGEDLFSAITAMMLIISLKSIKTEMTWKRSVYLLAATFTILAILSKFFESDIYSLLLLAVLLIFFTGSFCSAAKQVLFVGEIDRNKIIGSITLYLLLGLIWASIYLILIALDQNAFSGIKPGNWQQVFASASYYSFVTLTTLGYGDILPKNHIVEFFVYMEAIVGVFYMAIIVSSLINLRLASIQNEQKES